MRKGINSAVAVLLGLLIACAPYGQQAVAQQPAEKVNGLGGVLFLFQVFYGVSVDSENARIRAGQRASARQGVIDAYANAVHALDMGDSSAFTRNRRVLEQASKRSAEDYASIRNTASNLLATLPEKYTPGFAYQRQDGTIAADPSYFIRYHLMRERDIGFNGDGGGGD